MSVCAPITAQNSFCFNSRRARRFGRHRRYVQRHQADTDERAQHSGGDDDQVLIIHHIEQRAADQRADDERRRTHSRIGP